MPHAALKLMPGVDQNLTPTLNQAGISISNLIRFTKDASGLGLVQKLGGWARFYANAMPSIVRALWAWQDTNANKLLSVGCEPAADPSVGSLLGVIRNNSLVDITPHVLQNNVAVSVTTVTTSNQVTITDVGSQITNYDAVYVATHISVGGVIIFGFYPCIELSVDSFAIALTDKLGNPIYPTSNVTNGGVVAIFNTVAGSSVVTVTLPNHGYAVGDTYPVLVSTLVGGTTLSGNYVVQTVVDANNFTIVSPTAAVSTNTQAINGGLARYNFYLAFGPLQTGTGWGIGGWGLGGWGTGVSSIINPQAGINISTLDWSLDNWGEILIACPTGTTFGSPDNNTVIGGPIYYWPPETNASTAIPIAEGPIANTTMFVGMPQRQIIALGSTFNGVQDPLMIRWCDVNNFFQWIGQVTNQAGFFRLPRGSRIVGGLQVTQQGLIWTDIALWSMQYVGVGGPLAQVYSFNEIGTGCGLIAKKAAGVLGGTVYWMGQSQFFTFSGDGVQPLYCSVWDVIFQNLDTTNTDKIRIGVNSNFYEIRWEYPSLNGGGEVDSYVKYNAFTGTWDYGFNTDTQMVARSAWINQSVFGPPIGADPTNRVIYQHETSNDADGQPLIPVFRTGYFALNEADVLTFIDQFWPDMKWGTFGGTTANAQLLLTFYVAEYPNDTPQVFGPFTLSNAIKYVTPRFRGKLVAIEMTSTDVGSFWRVGGSRYRWQADGKFL